MELRCGDLAEHGVALIPPSSEEFAPLLDDIRRRLEAPMEGSPPVREPWDDGFSADPGAILVNRSTLGIAAFQLVWRVRDWRGCHEHWRGGGENAHVLLPFGCPADLLKRHRYWQVILPGSKRYLSYLGRQVGDNSDVRPPNAEEAWRGGMFYSGLPDWLRDRELRIEQLVLGLDGVFFLDGSFAGPNRFGMWEQVVRSAEAHRAVAEIARRGQAAGAGSEGIFAEIETLTGPLHFRPAALPLPGGSRAALFRDRALHKLAWRIAEGRRRAGDEATIGTLARWCEVELPRFRRL